MFTFKTPIKSFPTNYNYKITKLNLLGKGFVNEGVFKYQIEYFNKNNKLKHTQIMAGKTLSYSINLYKDLISFLKKHKLIDYTIRKFNLEKTQINTINFSKPELKNILFLTDFSLQNHNIEPINIFDDVNTLNPIIYTQLTLVQQNFIFTQILDSWLEITNYDLRIEDFDLWLVIFNNSEIFVQLVDLDCLYHKNHNEEHLDFTQNNLKCFLSNSPKKTKQLLYNLLSSPKYKLICKKYNFNNLEDIL
jgi:hypothetical protein